MTGENLENPVPQREEVRDLPNSKLPCPLEPDIWTGHSLFIQCWAQPSQYLLVFKLLIPPVLPKSLQDEAYLFSMAEKDHFHPPCGLHPGVLPLASTS